MCIDSSAPLLVLVCYLCTVRLFHARLRMPALYHDARCFSYKSRGSPFVMSIFIMSFAAVAHTKRKK